MRSQSYVRTLSGYYLPVVCRGICSNLEEDEVRDYLDPIMEDLAAAYLRILEKQKGKRKEFFGLRDFYRYCSLPPWSYTATASYHR